MGIFNSLFKGNSEAKRRLKINWLDFTESNQIEAITLQSNVKPILIFKHSTRCGVSRMSLKNFESEYDLNETAIDLYFLDILKYRSISNEVSIKFKVQHQSPQVIVLKKEKAIYQDSHFGICVKAVKKVLAK
jgi:bacillithiol system protein YtxJ